MTKEAIGDIGNIIDSASRIPFDRKDRKEERRKEQAQLIERLLPRVLSDPKFYQEIDGPTHLHGLMLLVALIPIPEHGYEKKLAFIKEPPLVHKTFVDYLRGIVENRVTMTHPSVHGERIDVDGKDENYKEKLGRHLRKFLDLPTDYLDMVYLEVGLPVDSKRNNQPLVIRGSTPGVEPPH